MIGVLIVCGVLVSLVVCAMAAALVRMSMALTKQSVMLYRLAAQYSLMANPNGDATVPVAAAVFGESEKPSSEMSQRRNKAARQGDVMDTLTPMGSIDRM